MTIQIKVIANTLHVPDVVKHELHTADICEWKVNFLAKVSPRFRADFAGLVLIPKSSIGNIERYLLRCRSFPMKRNSVFTWFRFSLFIAMTEQRPGTACKPFTAAAESPDA